MSAVDKGCAELPIPIGPSNHANAPTKTSNATARWIAGRYSFQRTY